MGWVGNTSPKRERQRGRPYRASLTVLSCLANLSGWCAGAGFFQWDIDLLRAGADVHDFIIAGESGLGGVLRCLGPFFCHTQSFSVSLISRFGSVGRGPGRRVRDVN